MKDKFFVDTNLLVYYRDASEPVKQPIAAEWLTWLWDNKCGRLSFQVLNEYYVTVTQKLKPGLSREDARSDIRNLTTWQPIAIEQKIMELAWEVQAKHQFSWWDALIISAAQFADCRYLLSEDMQHQQQLNNLIIINPFQDSPEKFSG